MGIFRSYLSNLRHFATRPFIYSVDRTPNLADGESTKLVGWVIGRGVTSLQLLLDGETIFEFQCTIPRFDVFRNFSNIEESILSGFELDFPTKALAQLGSGKLQLMAVGTSASEQLWAWDGFGTAEEGVAVTTLKQFFSDRQLSINISAREPAVHGVVPLHFVVETTGEYSYLIQLLKTLAQFRRAAGNSIVVRSLNVLLRGQAKEDEVRRVLSQVSLWDDVRIEVSNRLCDWNSVDSSSTELVFFTSEYVDCTYLDFPMLVAQFLELLSLSVLMPTVYGGPGGVSGPRGVSLGELSQLRSPQGEDLPLLFASKFPGPVWLTSRAFFTALVSDLGDRDGPLLPANSLTYHFDLRQPVVCRRTSNFSIPADERRIIDEFIRTELATASPVTATGPAVAFILTPDWFAGDADGGSRFQLLALARELRNQGAHIRFLYDGPGEDALPYIYGEQAIPFSQLTEEFSGRPLRWAIATSWEGVAAANVLRYVTGCEVVHFMQGLTYRDLRDTYRRETYERALCAFRGNSIPLVNSSYVYDEVALFRKDVSRSGFLPFQLNREIFSPLPIERNQNGIVLLIPSVALRSDTLVHFIEQISREIKRAEPRTVFTVALVGPMAHHLPRLLETVEHMVFEVSAAARARLFSSNQIVIDLSQGGELEQYALEAVLSGAIPLVSDPARYADFLVPEEQTLVFQPGDANSLSESVLRLLRDPELQQRLRKNGVLASKVWETPYPENLIDEISQNHQSLVHRNHLEHQRKAGVSVIIPVHNALDATAMCLRSVVQWMASSVEVIIVNDKSDRGTTIWLRQFTQNHPRLKLIELSENVGFIQACIAGVNAATPAHDIVLLNSDVVVSEGALERLQQAAYARWDIGLASPLSTGSPHLEITVNPGDSFALAAKKLSEIYQPSYPTVITPEGQMLYIRRSALERFGFFDSIYGRGFCEESDLCMRMFLSGVDMVCADNALIFHRRSASFGAETRRDYYRENRPIFDARWLRYYTPLYQTFLARNPLAEVRKRYADEGTTLPLPREPFQLSRELRDFRYAAVNSKERSYRKPLLRDAEVVFILPGVVLGGGSLSVLQHVNELLLRGIEARAISLSAPESDDYSKLAPVITITPEELFELDWSDQSVVATFWTTAYVVKGLSLRYPNLRPFYYVQDYEPWFHSRPDEFIRVKEAEQSYQLGLPSIVKTEFLRDILAEKQRVSARVIEPGVDHTTFYPGTQELHLGRPRLCGLFRPRTSRRGNRECIELIYQLRKRLPELSITLFGESVGLPDDLIEAVRLTGALSPSRVAKLYRESDLLIDLSYWQGFGRMGIEGMACGAVPIMSRSGGIMRYAEDGRNCFLVDLEDLNHVADRIILLAKDRELRMQMRTSAISTALRFSEERAVDDWLRIWGFNNKQESAVELGKRRIVGL